MFVTCIAGFRASWKLGAGSREGSHPALLTVRENRQVALERDRALLRFAPDQRHPRGHQQQNPARQTKGTRVPEHPKPHQHGLLPLRKTALLVPTLGRPMNQLTHYKSPRAKTN